jgi:phosphohistidine phosphatase SixA
MRVLLIRHATSLDGEVLSREGCDEAMGVAGELRRLEVVPDVVFTSSSGDAKQTSDVLSGTLGLHGGTGVLDALDSPRHDWFQQLLNELEAVVSAETVAIVGNEPRLSLILAQATGRRRRPLARAEAVSTCGNGLSQYRRGHADFEFRTGLKGEPEDVLRDKLQSKTAVATLLAGFTFAGLIELVTRDHLSPLQATATGLLTFSLALLVACIYVYDQLALPSGFWSAAERSVGREGGLRARLLGPLERFGHKFRMLTSRRAEARRAGFVFDHARRNHGVVYAYMVWTWQWLFTSAVFAALLAFELLIIASDTALLIAGGTFALVVAAGIYLAIRPRLGPD